MNLSNIWELIFYIPAILLALSVHEFSHGFVAYRLGDPTPKLQGRLTLNPLKHLDPMGTLLLIVAHFGWAKPVQVNPYYFQGDKKRGMMTVALAGPFSNILFAYLSALLLSLMLREILPFNNLFALFLQNLVQINLILAAFNLIPVPPLDGSKILAGILPGQAGEFFYSLEQYGPIILLILIVSGMIQRIFLPIVSFLYKIVFMATGIPI
ncbi:site-2 protease family protein [Dehalobacterium formicoaceticum]|uniref:Site-2 protease family protein n=1 Tax=Dehalobacterium formicoaceticum TaxID=51515 RepID=A0ABT1Y4P2_9FIRM|nr:site-2 protease family protein [Dehalobacterium formicoaceticum]MCR6545841.1 site-2 protease family protein [Dehalobacterium formicoaceticum]